MFHPTGRYLLTAADELILWKISTSEIAWWLNYDEPAASACFSNCGKYLILGTSKELKLIDISIGEILHKILLGNILHVSISKEDSTICALVENEI